MSLWTIAWRSIQQRSLASTLTAISMALGVALVVAVLVMISVVQESFQKNAGLGYNMLIGAKGSRVELVLNTVYHLGKPVENIPYSYYKEFLPADLRSDGREGRFSPWIGRAIPVCMGDYVGEFRCVGTVREMFEDIEYADGRQFHFAAGKNFAADDFFGGVIGSEVARKARLKVGDTFNPTHGAEDGHAHDPFTVRGILAETGTPYDRGVYVNMEGFYLLDSHALPEELQPHHHDDEAGGADHKHDAHGNHIGDAADKHTGDAKHDHDHAHTPIAQRKPLPENQREVTAILVRTMSEDGLEALDLKKLIDKGPTAQAVLPILEIATLRQLFVTPFKYLLLGLTAMIVVVAGLGIMVSIYNTMSERRREIAVMRALGAGRDTVMAIVLLESILLSLLGGFLGWVLGHLLAGVLGRLTFSLTGVSVGFLQFVPEYELILIPALVALASLVGFLPAMAAYRTDVARSLAANP